MAGNSVVVEPIADTAAQSVVKTLARLPSLAECLTLGDPLSLFLIDVRRRERSPV
jgi:hypothetical protein